MRHFLTRKWPIVNAHGEIGGVEVATQSTLHLRYALHQVASFIIVQCCEVRNASERDNQRVAFSAREDVQKSVKARSLGYAV
jgi:hypothetical protein